MALPPTPNAEEKSEELLVDDSKLLSNEYSYDSTKDVCVDNNQTWTPSVSSFDSDESNDKDCKKWKAAPIRPADFVFTYNKLESDLKVNHIQEVHKVERHILDSANVIRGKKWMGVSLQQTSSTSSCPLI